LTKKKLTSNNKRQFNLLLDQKKITYLNKGQNNERRNFFSQNTMREELKVSRWKFNIETLPSLLATKEPYIEMKTQQIKMEIEQ